MLSLSGKVRYYLYRGVTDMRKSFEGLGGIVRRELGSNPQSGDVYIFVNRRLNRLKLLVWDRDGYWIWYKRLEKGTFRLPSGERNEAEVSYEKLLYILAGIDEKNIRKRQRYGR